MIVFADNLEYGQKCLVYVLCVVAALPIFLISPWLLWLGKVQLVHRACTRTGAHLWRTWRYVAWTMLNIGIQIWIMQRAPTLFVAPSDKQWQMEPFLLLYIFQVVSNLLGNDGKVSWDTDGELPLHRGSCPSIQGSRIRLSLLRGTSMRR